MNKIIAGLIFFIIISFVIFWLQFFIAKQAGNIFNFKVNYKIVWLLISLSALVMFSNFISAMFWNKGIQAVYYITNSYLGLIWIGFWLAILYWLSRLLWPNTKINGYVSIGLLLILFVYSLINARTIKINEYSIDNEKIQNPVRVALITDLHVGAINREVFINKIVNNVNQLNPDITVIGGDLIDGSGKLNTTVMQPLNKLTAPAYFIYGNHEQYHGREDTDRLLASTDLIVLENKKVAINDTVDLIGIEHLDPSRRNQLPTLLEKFTINNEKYNIMVNHEPIDFSHWQDKKIDLQLSGHIHNGQIFPFNLVNMFVYKQLYGWYEKDNKQTYVSSGVGTWGPPLRLGSQAEIVIINLK